MLAAQTRPSRATRHEREPVELLEGIAGYGKRHASLTLLRHRREQFGHYAVGRGAFGFRFVAQDQAVA